MAGHPTFEQTWPDLSARLDATLLRRGIPPWLKDDVLQETGLRLLKVWDALDHERPLLPLAYTIARNLVADEIRRNRNVDVAEHVDTASDEFLTERAGIARIQLRQVEDALSSLTEKQRSVVLSDLGIAPPPDMGPDAIKMARMRARRSLLALLAGAGRLHAGVVVNFKRLLRTTEVAVAARDASGATAGALVAVAMLATFSSPPAEFSTSPGAPKPPRATAPVSSASATLPLVADDTAALQAAARREIAESKTFAPGRPQNRTVGDARAADETDPPAVVVGENEARAGAGVNVLGGGVQTGDDDQDDVSLCADGDSFDAGVVGDPNCTGRILSVQAGGDVSVRP